jgi:DNA repair protein RAD7
MAHLNPNLTSLRLDLCGRIDDTVMKIWCASLPALKRLELFGPFLVRVAAWQNFFESHPQLEGFLITQSPRFDLDCLTSLVTHCRGLKDLRLREIGKMEDVFADEIKSLQGTLQSLDLSEPGESLSEEVLLDMISVIAPTLTHLDLSNHDLIADRFLRKGLKPHLRVLVSLSLRHTPKLTDDGVAEFFETWASATDGGADAEPHDPNPPLVSLDLSRNHNLSSAALSAILAHSGPTLQNLNINGWKAASEESLNEIGQCARELRTLDVGFCREVDDFVMKGVIENCEKITEVKCWGCSRVTQECPRKVRVVPFALRTLLTDERILQKNVMIFGVESH